MVSSSTTIYASFVSKRPRSPESSLHKKVTIKVKNQQDGVEDIFRIGVHAHLKKLMNAYCDKKNIDYKTVRFIYNCKMLKPRHTPSQLMMEDGHLIDFVTDQSGG